jgi:hypothetical protein
MADFLTVEQILAVDDIPTETVLIPEWGGAVKVRGLSRAAYDAIGKAAEVVSAPTGPGQEPKVTRDDEKFSDALFLACVVEPKFTEAHLPALRQKSLGALNKVFEAIGRVLKTDVEPVKSQA